MDLQSAFVVKRSIEEIFATRTRRQFSLGVAIPSTGANYAIAVRAPSETELPDEALDAIRRKAAGEVDVRYTGRIRPIAGWAGSAGHTATIGSSVAHYECTAGTLGFFARRIDDEAAIGLVSNNHVLARWDQAKDGDEILHPAPFDKGTRPDDVVAKLVGTYPRLKRAGVDVDCAFARLVQGKAYDPRSLGNGRKLSKTTADPAANPDVSKIGRTTKWTNGRVTAIDVSGIEIDYPFGVLRFDRQIEIQAAENEPFSCPGDSGSLVFTQSGHHPVGLLFACSAAGGAGNLGLTYANSIDAVLKALHVSIVA